MKRWAKWMRPAQNMKLSFRYQIMSWLRRANSLGCLLPSAGYRAERAVGRIGRTDAVRSFALKEEANEYFITGGNVFSKLRERFPTNNWLLKQLSLLVLQVGW